MIAKRTYNLLFHPMVVFYKGKRERCVKYTALIFIIYRFRGVENVINIPCHLCQAAKKIMNYMGKRTK